MFPTFRRASARGWLRLCLAVIAVPVLALALYLAMLRLTGNFHEVIAGELYRSAQPTAEQVDDYIREYGIRSVINLRGPHPGTDWYDAETAVARSHGVVHRDFPMRASRRLSQVEAEELLRIMRDSPKPLLIHCQAGADRTGLATALYLAAISGVGEQRAEGAISIRYGHISLPVSDAWPMDQSWEQLEPWLGFEKS